MLLVTFRISGASIAEVAAGATHLLATSGSDVDWTGSHRWEGDIWAGTGRVKGTAELEQLSSILRGHPVTLACEQLAHPRIDELAADVPATDHEKEEALAAEKAAAEKAAAEKATAEKAAAEKAAAEKAAAEKAAAEKAAAGKAVGKNPHRGGTKS